MLLNTGADRDFPGSNGVLICCSSGIWASDGYTTTTSLDSGHIDFVITSVSTLKPVIYSAYN